MDLFWEKCPAEGAKVGVGRQEICREKSESGDANFFQHYEKIFGDMNISLSENSKPDTHYTSQASLNPILPTPRCTCKDQTSSFCDSAVFSVARDEQNMTLARVCLPVTLFLCSI
jgi:hypothetical protein